MSSMLKNLFSAIGVLTILMLSFILGQRVVKPIVITEIKRDTILVEKPVPRDVEKIRTEFVYVEIPADTIVKEVVRVDSVLVAIEVERRVYSDERYRAVVSGAAVGDIRPSLDEMEIYTNTETRIIDHKSPKFRPYLRGSIGQEAVGLGCGISFNGVADIDLQYMRVGSKNAIIIGANYKF